VGLSIAIMLGKDQFKQLLGGAHGLDEHFRTAPLGENLPVILALIGVWNSSFFKCKNQAILSYDYALRELPAYLQQLEMESTGKRVMRDGHLVSYNTCPVIFGAPGNNGQHAFYQMFHQGTQSVPCDFIVAIESQVSGYGDHQDKVLANAIAQSRALMMGRDKEHTAKALGMQADECMVQHRTFPGNQPSNTLLYQKLTPTTLGALIALYEHKVFVQSVCWGLNPFDQWGVELGKTMASALLPALQNAEHNLHYDASTEGLLRHIHGLN
jgi:glucose-6-phosphate isomerase